MQKQKNVFVYGCESMYHFSVNLAHAKGCGKQKLRREINAGMIFLEAVPVFMAA